MENSWMDFQDTKCGQQTYDALFKDDGNKYDLLFEMEIRVIKKQYYSRPTPRADSISEFNE